MIRIGRGYSPSELKEAGLANIAVVTTCQILIEAMSNTFCTGSAHLAWNLSLDCLTIVYAE
ncbi:MAG TPA: hypothetical protein VE223_07145 [Nitrososphaeraceae archaeon]|nr:hypothetical protein [Nitrososphaeraceae archaeon]